MEASPMTCRTLEAFYHIDDHTFEKQYKEVLSGFCQWEQLEHADERLLFPYYVGPRLSIDESSLSNGEMHTFVTNYEALALALPVVQVADKWTGRQKHRAKILFEEYPDIKTAYVLCHSLRTIFAKNTIKDAVCLSNTGTTKSKKQDSIPLMSSPPPSMNIIRISSTSTISTC